MNCIWQHTDDANGNVLAAKDPLNKAWTYTYNSKNDVLTVTDLLTKVGTLAYTSGNLSSVTDPLSHATSFTDNAFPFCSLRLRLGA